MGFHIIQIIKHNPAGIAFLFTAAVLIFICPLLIMFIMRYVQRYKSLKWLMNLNATNKNKTQRINFIPL
jgi:hypothetical protein